MPKALEGEHKSGPAEIHPDDSIASIGSMEHAAMFRGP
jgi:hypothetical protein